MSIYRRNKEFYDKPIRLTRKERKKPFLVIDEFLAAFHLSEIREDLEKLTYVAITSKNDEFQKPEERANILLLKERLEQFLEAIYLLRTGKRTA